MEHPALNRMGQLSKKAWFIAVYRWAMMLTVPLILPIFIGTMSWLLIAVVNSQTSIATIDAKVTAVIFRVDSLESANNNALAERLADGKTNAEQTASISSRLSALEANNGNLTKSVDRLVRLLDDRLPPAPRGNP